MFFFEENEFENKALEKPPIYPSMKFQLSTKTRLKLFCSSGVRVFEGTTNNITTFIFQLVKFTFSDKATKIDKIFTINLTVCYVVTVKSTVKIPSIFVAFLENMNFTTVC